LRQQGAPFAACRFHVYRRAGLPCYRCGTDIIGSIRISQR
jgi:formamidopyrimidine-DNA glycosylase